MTRFYKDGLYVQITLTNTRTHQDFDNEFFCLADLTYDEARQAYTENESQSIDLGFMIERTVNTVATQNPMYPLDNEMCAPLFTADIRCWSETPQITPPFDHFDLPD